MKRASGVPLNRGEPPPIPGARMDSTGQPRRPLLIWVRTGVAHVSIDGAETFRLGAGEGAWIPSEGWDHRAIVTDPGTVAFPLWPDARAGTSSEPIRFDVPVGWQDWLIQFFNLQETPLAGSGYSWDVISRLLQHSASSAVMQPGGVFPAGLELPEMPRSRSARTVAEQLVHNPALGLTAEQWAERTRVSSRTLLRDFVSETGLTFVQWRTRCRLVFAVDTLAAGCDVDQAAARVGFASRNGFTRAFKQRFGIPPAEFRRQLSSRPAAGSLDTLAHQTGELMRMVRGRGASPSAPELLPAMRTPLHANDRHVLSWMYRGSGYVDIDDRHYERERGTAIWIPADAEHITGIRRNSISLKIGEVPTSMLTLTEPLQVQFSPAWDDYLMFCAVAVSVVLQPDDYDADGVILHVFGEQVAAQRSFSVPMPSDSRARAAALYFLRRIGTPDDRSSSELPAELHRVFREQTGMTFARWRTVARMRIARDLLIGGAKPNVVARRAGFAHLSNFSATFSRFHGISPRDYQERETGKP